MSYKSYIRGCAFAVFTSAVWLTSHAYAADISSTQSTVAPRVTYQNFREPEAPWSIHVVRVPRRNSPFQLQAMHANGRALGLAPVSDQATKSAAIGLPVAAVNGDFYERDGPYAGDPRGLQIMDGELISAPTGTASFWVDAVGEPHTTNTASMLQVTWPDGSTAPLELNGTRGRNGVQLYTPTMGTSTRTAGGRELVLKSQGTTRWLPLRPGKTFHARVQEVRDKGDSRIEPETLVLSIGPTLAKTALRVDVGAELVISTATSPSLLGVKTAISGGPVLVHDGKAQRIRAPNSDSYEFSSMSERHPRSAIGWNEDYFFLVTVDGRQRASVGMTLKELAAYLVKLGCKEAMNLDGGGSATLWYAGKVRNRPCDGGERDVANSLVVVEKRTKAIEGAAESP